MFKKMETVTCPWCQNVEEDPGEEDPFQCEECGTWLFITVTGSVEILDEYGEC